MADLSIVSSLDAVDAASWDALDHKDSPFLSHAFLRLLERSGSVGRGTGWDPRYLVAKERGEIVGAVPAYLRTDSYGEYVFDWSWAQAASRAGLPYYPKITVAVPFTPATGPRLLYRPGHEAVRTALVDGLAELCRETRAHGVHVLLCRDEEAAYLEAHGYARRATHQFHFRNPGYASFDDFLGALRSSGRKQLRKERQRVAEQDVQITVERGDQVSDAVWERVNELYLHTSSRKWGRPYLTPQFFSLAKEAVGPNAVLVLARQKGEIVAMSLSFEKGGAIFGRYWGAEVEIDGLHFELCYHRLVEHAISRGMKLVEAGAQGEHKVKRGFLPVITHSAHKLVHPGLFEAVSRAIAAERREAIAALPQMAAVGPFREDAVPPYPLIAGIDL